MAWMEVDYKYHSKDSHFRWELKWRLECWGALRIMGEAAPLARVVPKSYQREGQSRKRENEFSHDRLTMIRTISRNPRWLTSVYLKNDKPNE